MAVRRSSTLLFFTFTLLLSSQVLTAQVPDREAPVGVPKERHVRTDAPEQPRDAAGAGGIQACCRKGGVCSMRDPSDCFYLSRGPGSTCSQDAGPNGVDNTCADLPRMSLLPVGTGPFHVLAPGASIDGSEITLVTDGVTTQTVFLEVRIGDWDPDDVGIMQTVYEADIDVSGFRTGAAGMLGSPVVPCDDDRDCLEAFGGVCELGGSACVASGIDGGCPFPSFNRCGGSRCSVFSDKGPTWSPVFIQRGRNDFVSAGAPGLSLILDPRLLRLIAVSGGVDDPDLFPAEGLYAGTLVLDVGPNVRGTFTVGLLDNAFQPIFLHQNGLVPLLAHVPAKITVVLGGACCDDLAGTCSARTEADCTGSGLRYGGDGTDCASLTPACVVRIGACCDGITESCSVTTEAECLLRGFRFGGDGSDCTSIRPVCGVPTVTGWGLAVRALSLLTLSKLRFRESRNLQREA